MKVLVTGAAGFIGFHVTKRLLDRGDQVIGLDNLNDYYDPTLKQARLAQLTGHPRFAFAKLELADRAAMEALFANGGIARVVHLAAQAGVRYSIENPHAYVDSNLVGFLHILEGCRHHGSGTSCTRPRARCTAPTRRCPSPCTTTSTIRSRSTPHRRRRTS
jgi:UDP-glucuronate 4-epimerase